MIKDPKVVSVGEHFGGDAVSVVIALLSEAMLQNKGGTVEVHFRTLAHDAFTEREKAQEIVRAFVDNGFLKLEEGHDVSVVVSFPAWSRHQAAFRKAKSRASKATSQADVTPSHEHVTPGHKKSPTGQDKTEQEKTEQKQVGIADAPMSHLLANLIESNGAKRPTVGKKWADAERLLLTADGRDHLEAERLLRWCQNDDFWRGNILSMPKFREKYDQLLLQAKRGTAPKQLSPAERRANEIRSKREARA